MLVCVSLYCFLYIHIFSVWSAFFLPGHGGLLLISSSSSLVFLKKYTPVASITVNHINSWGGFLLIKCWFGTAKSFHKLVIQYVYTLLVCILIILKSSRFYNFNFYYIYKNQTFSPVFEIPIAELQCFGIKNALIILCVVIYQLKKKKN